MIYCGPTAASLKDVYKRQVGACVVKVLSFNVELDVAQFAGEPLKVRDRRRPSLKFSADAAQLAYKLAGLAYSEVCLGDLVHRRLELRGNI